MSGTAAALAGIGVLVTRPAHQAAGLCQAIEAHGGIAHRFPVLEIADPPDPAPLQAMAATLETYDWAIFISANAVSRALQGLLGQRDWPASVKIAVIGRRSAVELERFGLQPDLCPSDKYDSEALLALAPLADMQGKRVVIFRGDGGREQLAETLRARGAHVDYVEAYRRRRPQADATSLLEVWAGGGIDVVLVNSAESLRNLVAMLGEAGRARLLDTPLLVVSERMLPLAGELGFRHPPVLAANATDAAVLAALLAWREAGGGHKHPPAKSDSMAP